MMTDPATPKQISYIKSLVEDRPEYPYKDWLLKLLPTDKFTKERAAAAIKSLLAFPAKDSVTLPKQGIYTVVLSNGQHRTFRFYAGKGEGWEGKTLVAYLSGQNNESDYTRFAHVDQSNRLHVWKKFSDANEILSALTVLNSSSEQKKSALEYALESGHCARCNKVLTVPTSLHQGYGPECIKYVA